MNASKEERMPTTEQKNLLSAFFLVAILVLPFVLLYLTSFLSGSRQAQNTGGYPYYQESSVNQATKAHLLGLPRDQRVIVDDYALAYRGMKKGYIVIDLYLLPMDPEQAYTKRFLQKDAKKELRIGEKIYRLHSARKQIIVLQAK